MIHRSSSSTLFPYTTLFRSRLGERHTGRGVTLAVLDTGIDQGHPDFAGRIAATRSFVAHEPDIAHRSGQDRKSTRLNSSHSQISYAVFCLKKKNRAINRFTT